MAKQNENYDDLIDCGFESAEDFDNSRAWGGEAGALPPGVYVFEVSEVKKGQSKGGHPQVQVVNKVADGEHVGRQMSSYFVFSGHPVAKSRFKSLAVACGAKPTKSGAISMASLVGKKYRAKVVADTYFETDPLTTEKKEKTSFKILGEEPI